MTVLMTLEGGEELVWEPSFGAHQNPSANYLLARGFDLTWGLKSPGTRKALMNGLGKHARPLTRSFCSACVIKRRLTHLQPNPLSVVCLAERFFVWLGTENTPNPKTFIDLNDYTALQLLGPTWRHAVQQGIGGLTWQGMIRRPGAEADEEHDRRWLRPARQFDRTTGTHRPYWEQLDYGQVLWEPQGLKPTGRGRRMHADPLLVWDTYQKENLRLAAVALEVMNNRPFSWQTGVDE